jgi:hypothetical protein
LEASFVLRFIIETLSVHSFSTSISTSSLSQILLFHHKNKGPVAAH